MSTLEQSDFHPTLDIFGTASRRVFVKGLGSVGASLLLATTLGGCEKILEAIRNRPMRRRIRAGSPEVDADVATYRNAVALMKQLPASDPRNWVAQATIHGTAAGFNMCEHGTSHFFDWHRAYLFNFEKICQKLTNTPKFALPYWNWNQDPDVPAPFLDSASPLFSSRSRTTMAGNSAVSTPQLDIIFQDTNFFTFSTQLEVTPHNTVHTWIGGILAQGNSPIDALFWNHHCMVDYCWYKWNVEMGRQNPNDQTWLGKVNGQFVDADKNPSQSTAAMTILMPLLAYQYESSAIGSSPAKAAIKSAAEFRQLEARLKAGAPIRFVISGRNRIAATADLSNGKPAMLRSTMAVQNFARILESNSVPERVFLSVQTANAPQPQDVFVRVFVNLTGADAATSTDDPHYAGSFAFFGNPAQMEKRNMSAAEAEHPRFLVDLTHTLRKLAQQGGLAPNAPVTIQLIPAPVGGQASFAGSQLVLEGVDIITSPVVVAEATAEPR